MPQTSDAMRNLMERWFPNEDAPPEASVVAFLESHGFKLTPGWQWELPVPSHTISDIEWLCMRYLVEEWDYGGIANKTPQYLEEGE